MVVLAQIDLYQGDFQALAARLDKVWPAFKRSGVLRANVWGNVFALFRMYAALLSDRSHRHVRPAQQMVRRFLKSKYTWQSGFGNALDACIHLRGGDTELATRSLGLATEAFERSELSLYAASARFQRGKLLAGPKGALEVAAAEQLLRAQGIVSPERWAAMYVPLPPQPFDNR